MHRSRQDAALLAYMQQRAYIKGATTPGSYPETNLLYRKASKSFLKTKKAMGMPLRNLGPEVYSCQRHCTVIYSPSVLCLLSPEPLTQPTSHFLNI